MRVTPDSELGFRGLTVRQPHASAIASGRKRVEYRSWGSDFRGDLLVTSSARPDTGYSDCADPCGVAICVVQVVDVIDAHDCFEWVLRRPRAVRPIPVKGKLLLWTVARELVDALGLKLAR